MELKEGMYVRTKDGKIFDCYVSEQMGNQYIIQKVLKLMDILITRKFIRNLNALST